MDDLDRRLIAELRINSRASLPKLAEILNVARGTVQTRLDRLIKTGTIKSFTIRVNDELPGDMLRAIILIELSGRNLRNTISLIRRVPGVASLSNTNGVWDIIADIEVPSVSEMNQVISEIRLMNGVEKSETFMLLGPA